MDFFHFACFKKNKNMEVEKKLRVMMNFYNKQCLPVITWNKKHLMKRVLPKIYTLEKKIFALATFEKLHVVSSQSA